MKNNNSSDYNTIIERTALETGLKTEQIAAVAELLEEGCTVPFISRYRKERTRGLDEVNVLKVEKKITLYNNLEKRRHEVKQALDKQGKLTPALQHDLSKCASLREIEDFYAPLKSKKKSRGMLGREKGLGPLARLMIEADSLQAEKEIPIRAKEFLREISKHKKGLDAEQNIERSTEQNIERSTEQNIERKKGLNAEQNSIAEVLQGAEDIIAEDISRNLENRAIIKKWVKQNGSLTAKGKGDENAKITSTYSMYWNFCASLTSIKDHQILAINRGEKEGALKTVLKVDITAAAQILMQGMKQARQRTKGTRFFSCYYHQAVADGVERLLVPAVLREIKAELTEQAEEHAISVFAANLEHLLLQPPIKGTRVLGIDPGLRTGSKCTALDAGGTYLGSFVVFAHDKEKVKKALLAAKDQYQFEVVAIGNGTGSREIQNLISEIIKESASDLRYTIVDEDGASVYSAGTIAKEEFPNLDVTIRGAISIARRLQDPLAELVKIEPKSIGVGLYQHDLPAAQLSAALKQVVELVVNRVGVNVNTAGFSLLAYVSGIKPALARNIVKYRESNGGIFSREELKEITGMGAKSFEQAAGFLKIRESRNPLDNTWVHPENYDPAEKLLPCVKTLIDEPGPSFHSSSPSVEKLRAEIKNEYGIGDITIDEIITELTRPNLDPRSAYPPPLFQESILDFDDLKEGMLVQGKVKNVVDFGAFVDIGIKENGLVHISEIADRFITNPMDVLQVGDIRQFKIISLEPERSRVGLSLRGLQKTNMQQLIL